MFLEGIQALVLPQLVSHEALRTWPGAIDNRLLRKDPRSGVKHAEAL